MQSVNENISIKGGTLNVRFGRFGISDYQLFLKTKRIPEALIRYDRSSDSYTVQAPARFARLLDPKASAIEAGEYQPANHLFDYQRFIVSQALNAQRYAIWADCGLGKTAMFLDWSRNIVSRTDGRVLILSPLQIIPQTIEESARWYGKELPVKRVDSRETLISFCREEGPSVGIVNYEKFIPGVIDELRYLSGLVCDESSILKSGGGVIKWNLIKSARGIENKLSCTATPAPNDTMEYASQASFLEKLRTEGEILWTYFTRDKHGNWQVKPHAREAFYRFMAGWSIYLRNPAAYGWKDNLSDVPPPAIYEEKIQITNPQAAAAQEFITASTGELFAGQKLGVTQRSKLSQIAKGFMYGENRNVYPVFSHKPKWVANKIREEISDGRQVLVWTVFDAESDLIMDQLSGEEFSVECLNGSMKENHRIDVLERFRHGQTQALISKASLIGYGMNFQFCASMIFSGWDDSYERFYQAVRRAYRYGQTKQLNIWIPYIPELEGHIYENVLRKKALFEADTAEQEKNYIEAMKGLLPCQKS